MDLSIYLWSLSIFRPQLLSLKNHQSSSLKLIIKLVYYSYFITYIYYILLYKIWKVNPRNLPKNSVLSRSCNCWANKIGHSGRPAAPCLSAIWKTNTHAGPAPSRAGGSWPGSKERGRGSAKNNKQLKRIMSFKHNRPHTLPDRQTDRQRDKPADPHTPRQANRKTGKRFN